MRIPRIFTNQDLTHTGSVTLEKEPSRHLSQVLRLKPGADLLLFNGNGNEYAARLLTCQKNAVEAELTHCLRHEPPPPLHIHLTIGISRGERMDFALQKSVELGVTEIQPIFSERCVVKLDDKRLARRMDHWQKIIIGACEQSGRCHIPILHKPVGYSSAVENSSARLRILLDHRSDLTLTDVPAPSQDVQILVGPEGGLSGAEREIAKEKGFTGIRLGPRVLRTETAPLAAISAMQILWGDLAG
ncbi:MAG: 16S rRNA (uracil(1498)-N(3))-methyltransferase [gamma proteobacterium endosymbiont of Lamellibrachia anaximandri]|nr:16S rRNA (uracil(1498)-N(3))-methyltransferase [gamma proteobacterium endosymbiont of Lamellibrachia anaximandri]MBL3533940.1 16S rRNA (uracil(1498)-N(3))-methyltransferase [gamma proteobacterium endosymbiont of Lamellibrachia anaximandri]